MKAHRAIEFAHEQVIALGGATMIVSACGLDRVYPARNAGLFDRILALGGALVSEYPPGVAPARHRFLTRNRLVAALSQGVVSLPTSRSRARAFSNYCSTSFSDLLWRMFTSSYLPAR